MKPLYVAVEVYGEWAVRAQDASQNYFEYVLRNIPEWQARAIAAILNGG